MIANRKQPQLSNLHGRIARIRQKNAELQRFVAALREDKDMFFDQIDNQPVYAYQMAPDGTIISVSPALLQLLGYVNIDELRAKSAANGEYDAAYVRELFEQSGGRITQIESTWRCKDGSIVHVRESARAIYDEQGRPTEYEGIIEEIAGPERVEAPRTQHVPAAADEPQPAADIPVIERRGAGELEETQNPPASTESDDRSQHGNVSATNQPAERSADLEPRRYTMPFPATQQASPIPGNLERQVLKQYAALLWRWAWLIVLGAALCAAAAFGMSSQSVPVYAASTTLLLNQATTGSGTPDYGTLLAGEMLAKTYAELMRKRPVLEEVVANLKLADDPDALAGQITVSAVRDTQLIILTVEDTDPQRAADIANETVRVFSRQNQALQTSRYVDTRQSLERELAKIQLDIDRTQAGLADLKTTTSPADVAERDRLQALLAQYRDSYATLLKSMGDVQLAELQSTNTISVAEPARPESGAIRPRTMRNTLLGLIAGMLLAIGIAVLIEYLDDRVKSSVQVTELAGTMTLGMIGQIDEPGPNGKLVTVRKKQSPVAEAYRMLRVNLDFAAIDRPLRVIAVTSGGPEEGKSTTIANLAVAIAQTGKQVILVDTDLRRPTLHHIFQVPNDRGVTTALLNPNLDGVRGQLVHPGVNNLLLLPSGPIPPNPAELLGSQRMADLIDDLKGQADVVLFDTPPMLVFADATLLARICDGTLLVARARFTRIGALVQSRQQIDQAGARLLGVVLNRVPRLRGGNQSYYYYYGAQPDAQPKRRFLGLRWPFARAGKPAENVPPAAASDMQRLQAAMSAVKRNGTALDGAIDRADVSVGVERGPINSHGGNGHGAQLAANGSQVDLAVSRNGNGSYPGSKQRP